MHVHFLRVLFQNKAEVWEEIEAISSDNDIPTQKTANKVCFMNQRLDIFISELIIHTHTIFSAL